MDVNDKARDLHGQAARTSHVRKLGTGYSWGDWRDSLIEPCEPTPDELELLQSQVAGHRWDGWRRLTGDEGYFAACSCGWRSSETGGVGPMLCQAKEHLAAVLQVRGGRRGGGLWLIHMLGLDAALIRSRDGFTIRLAAGHAA